MQTVVTLEADAEPGERRNACGPSSNIDPSRRPLIVLDGVVLSPSSVAFSSLDPDDVLDVTVARGAEAVRRYGSAGGGGVIEITTRNAPPRPAPSEAPVLFPNPVAAGAPVTLRVDSAGGVRAEVFDVLGRHVLTLAAEFGASTLFVPTVGLAPGAYVVRVVGAGGAVSRTVVVQ